MGRNKYSEKEIKEIGKLLRLKNAANRFGQKQIRHQLRVDYEFNIADFNEPGKAFGEDDLLRAVERGAIVILRRNLLAGCHEGMGGMGGIRGFQIILFGSSSIVCALFTSVVKSI